MLFHPLFILILHFRAGWRILYFHPAFFRFIRIVYRTLCPHSITLNSFQGHTTPPVVTLGPVLNLFQYYFRVYEIPDQVRNDIPTLSSRIRFKISFLYPLLFHFRSVFSHARPPKILCVWTYLLSYYIYHWQNHIIWYKFVRWE